jgi:hypothetical protein
MENNESNRNGVVFLFEKTLDHDDGARRKGLPTAPVFADSEAEQDLNGLTGKPGFAMVLLAILQDSSFEVKNRISAATYFKNYIRRHWDSTVQIS